MSDINKIVFATNNANKLQELRDIVGDKYEILGLKDIGCDVEIPETSDTLEGNAEIKARFIKEHYGYDCFADDTGLEVEELNGAPGVMSARYAGDSHNSSANMELLLSNMKNKKNRKARFRTVIALNINDEIILMDGVVNGVITHSPQGKKGFGYDPIFKPDGYEETFAMMDSELKNSISHRGKATSKLIEYLSRL